MQTSTSTHDVTESTSVTTDLPSQEGLAQKMQGQGRLAEAEALLRSVLSARLSTLDGHDPDVMRAKNNLAACLNAQRKDLVYAETLQLEVVSADREQHGSDHPDVLSGLNNLAHIYGHQGRYGKAIEIQREILLLSEKARGQADEDTVSFKENLANSLVRHEEFLAREASRSDSYDETERLLRDMLSREGMPGLARLSATANLGAVLRARGDYANAEAVYREALTLARDVGALVERQTRAIQQSLGDVRKESGKSTD